MEEDWFLETVRYKDIEKVISKIKPSRSRGDNEVTNLMIREIPQYATLATMHLFNCMVRTGIFPKEYQVSRFIPLKKKDKDDLDINSHRPVNNLNPIEKCIKHLLKEQMDKFLKDENILLQYHHCTHKVHSTVTATQAIQHKLNENKDNKLNIAILLTDLSSAFDTVEHSLLKSRISHIGIRGKALELISSFLHNRKFFVEV